MRLEGGGLPWEGGGLLGSEGDLPWEGGVCMEGVQYGGGFA